MVLVANFRGGQLIFEGLLKIYEGGVREYHVKVLDVSYPPPTEIYLAIKIQNGGRRTSVVRDF